MSTTAASMSIVPRGAGLGRPALLALCALFAWAVPAAAQADALSLRPPTPPRIDGSDGLLGRTFWDRLREEARSFRELNTGPLVFARRYRIPTELARAIHGAAQAEGIDPELGFRLVYVESRFNPRARSHAGALGLTQLMPRTARWLDRRMNTPERVMDPERNLRVGFLYLRRLIDKYDGDIRLALLAYNRGEGSVDRDLRRGRNPENGYARRVLGGGLSRYRGDGVLTR